MSNRDTEGRTCWSEPGTSPSVRRTRLSSPWWSTSGLLTLSPPTPNRRASKVNTIEWTAVKPERTAMKTFTDTKILISDGRHNLVWKNKTTLCSLWSTKRGVEGTKLPLWWASDEVSPMYCCDKRCVAGERQGESHRRWDRREKERRRSTGSLMTCGALNWFY